MRFMNLQYVKRYRMQLDLRRWQPPRIELPCDYRLVSWHPSLLLDHAEVKYASFRGEIDSQIFPCLGELDGCEQLMSEIEARDGFLPEGTWLAEYIGIEGSIPEYCGTIQTLRTQASSKRRGGGIANIQNIGVTPFHRGRGIGTALILASLLGLHHVGIRQVCLEVTAENESAVRLYRQLGFRIARTLYKAVESSARELAYSDAGR